MAEQHDVDQPRAERPWAGDDRRVPQPWSGDERRQNPGRVAEVRLTDKTIDYLEERIAQAVRDGIAAAITEESAERFWGAGMQVLQKQAAAHTGRFVLGGLWGIGRRAAVFLVVGGVVYALGGWSALAALFKAMFHSGG